MSTDFLDLLEAELHAAAERRGQPQPRRHRPSKGAFKVIVALAVIALFVFAAARLLDRTDDTHPANPTPTPTPDFNILTATAGQVGMGDLLAAKLAGSIPLNEQVGGITADRSLGSVVLYRPESDGAREMAERAASLEKIDKVRALTKAEARAFDNPTGPPDVVVVYGPERERQMLADPNVCAPAGGSYKRCAAGSGDARVSVIARNNRPLWIENLPGQWLSWAALSPDGKSMLIEKSGECALPQAWVGDARFKEGEQGVVGGVAEPLGWTTDGRMILFVPRQEDTTSGCGSQSDPGLYLVTATGGMTRVGDHRVPRSLDPRTPQQLTG